LENLGEIRQVGMKEHLHLNVQESVNLLGDKVYVGLKHELQVAVPEMGDPVLGCVGMADVVQGSQVQARDTVGLEENPTRLDFCGKEVDFVNRENLVASYPGPISLEPVGVTVGALGDLGPSLVVADLAQVGVMDSEDTISDFSLHEAEVNNRRCKQKVIRKKLPYSYGTPKSFQLVEALSECRGKVKRKGRVQEGGLKIREIVEDNSRTLSDTCSQRGGRLF